MNREETIEYLRKALDKNLEQMMRQRLNSYGYHDTFSIRSDIHEFEEVMKYIEENLK